MSLVCNFEKDFCGGIQEKQPHDKFDWDRRRTPTSSGGTGPSIGYGGKGYYAYIETSSPRKQGDDAKLVYRPNLGNRESCISFYYHMTGKGIGELNVKVNGKIIFKKNGQQGVDWKKAQIKVKETARIVIFQGIRGRSWQGDIAIDNIEILGCGGEGSSEARLPSVETGLGRRCYEAALVIPTVEELYLGAHSRVSEVDTEQDFRVTKVITHPLYHKPKSYSHDIALLKLDKPARLNSYVNTACLPETIEAPVEGKRCWITGWGRLSSGGATPDDLQQVSVPIVGPARCEKAYPDKIHDSMICAGVDEGGIDSCQGDSGGPMVCESGGRFYLQGATSWGYGCAAAGKFGVYAKVKYLLPWLKEKMRHN
ncbi:hypothetical protein pdam_00016944 [Pocillopora damicornis]|uniref:Peptidase S1 domain-containing protein n=1 Tax=Pocillopora damicornis TaxID=46731 RepID=A0A3M6TQG0_POCDA|nr:hypothetical protein pdam_00016944 [Pocillopora damicornis]